MYGKGAPCHVGSGQGRDLTAAVAVPVARIPSLIGADVLRRSKHRELYSIQAPHICQAAVDDAAAEAAAAASAAAAAAERRRLREQRRAARQQAQEVEQPPEAPQQPQPTIDTVSEAEAAGTVAASESADDHASGAAALSGSAPAQRPSSRLAARRQQRARLRSPKGRVPAALVPDDLDDDDSSSSDEDVDEDVIISNTGFQEADVDEQSDTAASSSSLGTTPALDGDQQDPAEAQTTLPQSVLQRAGAQRRPRQQRQPQQQAGSGSSEQPAAEQQQQQQRGGGGAERGEPLELSEASPMYLPVLTDEDLEADPPGHKSGYVAVIGRPNAGKSTLINAIVGQKLSIVTYKPQTTRHRVVGIASDTNYQMILFDTPGIMQEQRSKLDERMMAAVVSSIKAAEVIIAVVDSSDDPQEALAMFQPGPDWSGPPMAVLLNKTDLLSEEQVQQLQEWYLSNCRAEKVFVGSALESTDAGVGAIKAWAVEKLPEGPTLYPKSMVSEQPERFFVSEIIREQIFVQYEKEIPYSCQVQIVDFKERRNAKDYIQAMILVERETQVPIILGRGAAAMKKLGSASRQQIEDFLGRPVYLELGVQVAPAWRQQADKLKDFGYYDALYVS